MKLYELTAGYQRLLELIEEDRTNSGDYDDTLESLEDAIEDKAENLAKVIKSVDAQAEVIRAEEKRLADRRRALENQSIRMKEYLQQNLEAAGVKRVKGSILTVAIQKNPASVKVADETLIPKDFFVPQPDKLDKKAILQALKDGLTIDGCEMSQSESVRIR